MIKLKQLKRIDTKHKFPVFGYIRRVQNESDINIPMMINYLCLVYFFHGEFFVKCGDNLQISDGDMTLTKIGLNEDWKDTAYCKKWVQSNIKQLTTWKFKIDCIPSNDTEYGSIWIYFVSGDHAINNDCGFCWKDRPFYGFNNKGLTDFESLLNPQNINCGERIMFEQNDILTVSLDTSKRMITARIQNQDMLIIKKDIDIDSNIKYQIAVQLRERNTAITLLDFTSELQ